MTPSRPDGFRTYQCCQNCWNASLHDKCWIIWCHQIFCWSCRVPTELTTALLKVLAGILRTVDSGDLALLRCLICSELSIYTVDHARFQCLMLSAALFTTGSTTTTSYTSGRWQYVWSGSTRSMPAAVLFGVPQGSVLIGTIVFPVVQSKPLLALVETRGLQPHHYADDKKIYGFCRHGDNEQLQ